MDGAKIFYVCSVGKRRKLNRWLIMAFKLSSADCEVLLKKKENKIKRIKDPIHGSGVLEYDSSSNICIDQSTLDGLCGH